MMPGQRRYLWKGGTEKQIELDKNYSKGNLEKSGHTSNYITTEH